MSKKINWRFIGVCVLLFIIGNILFPYVLCRSVIVKKTAVVNTVSYQDITNKFDLMIPQAQNMVIDSQAKLNNLTSQNIPTFVGNNTQLPKLNFTGYTYLGIFAGLKPDGSYGIKVNKIIDDGSKVKLYYQIYQSPKDASIQILTYPYQIVQIAKTTKPIEFISQ